MPRQKHKRRKQQLQQARSVMLENKRRRLNNEPESEQPQASSSVASEGSASRLKIEKMRVDPADNGQEQCWTLTHIWQLTKLLSDVLCPQYLETGLSVTVKEKENAGFAAKLKLSCDGCGYEKYEFSPPRVGFSEKKNVAFEINPKMVLFSHEIGKSHTALETFGAVIGMPVMHLTTFQDHDKRVSGHEVDAGEELLQRTARAVRQAYAEVDPDIQEALDQGQTPIIDISVSFDGTWQKRGFTSLYGAGLCIDVLTGLCIDYDIRSKYCHACKLKEASGLPAEELAAWKADHAADCCINHTMSSKTMEQESAKVLWGRRMKKADAVTSAEAREHRKDYAAQRRAMARQEEERDGDVYAAGTH